MFKLKSKLVVVFTLIVGIIVFESCEKEAIQDEIPPVQYVDLLFGGGNSLKSSDAILVKAEVISTAPFKLKSDEIKEVNVTLQSGIKTYGYVLDSKLKWEIKKCYVLMSDGCFHYGTLYRDNEGETIFAASTDYNERNMHPEICPEPGTVFTK
jgi:hypothetical protein